MQLVTKATLLSALVFPGTGEWVVGLKKRALAIILSEVFLLILFFVRLWVMISDIILPGGDISQMNLSAEAMEQIHHHAYADNWWLVAVILAIYIFSIFQARKKAKDITASGGAQAG